MQDLRKVAVSLRMPQADMQKVRVLAERLGTRESDVIRFAIRTMIERLGSLCEQDARGRELVPALVESSTELLRFFDLDAARLDAVINEGVEDADRVRREDIALLAMAARQAPLAALKLKVNGFRPGGDENSARGDEVFLALRQYLYDRYVFAGVAK